MGKLWESQTLGRAQLCVGSGSVLNQKNKSGLGTRANVSLRTELSAQVCLARPASPSVRPHLMTLRPAQVGQLEERMGLCRTAALPEPAPARGSWPHPSPAPPVFPVPKLRHSAHAHSPGAGIQSSAPPPAHPGSVAAPLHLRERPSG
ncbi:hypothetical protein PAL_GLEAN10011934 [Pteropus alecto]|uniref:Uncharacterized protein n=1 Tax=Pteropus alecto TaxID=9402 RepID=L5KKD9_PTEAL|nr:hypothetical protein PAL_GLEAN10011934 [Pteropus alecto]